MKSFTIEQINVQKENRVLTAMVMNSFVLGRIVPQWESPGLFSSEASNIIGTWCVRHHRKYREAPRGDIFIHFRRWAARQQNEDLVKRVSSFLSQLSKEYEERQWETNGEINPQVSVDEAAEVFAEARRERLPENLSTELRMGRPDVFDSLIRSYRKVELGVGAGIDLFRDEEQVRSTFTTDLNESLVDYPGPIGDFFQGLLQRDGFIGFMAPQKVGKTFCLLDLAYRGVLQRRRVAYFQVGDLSERQIKLRFMVRNSQQPHRSRDGWPATVRIPKRIVLGERCPTVEYKEKIFQRPLDPDIAWEQCQKLMRVKVKSEESYFKLMCYPTLGIGVPGILSALESLQLDGWNPDIVVIDYADNLSPINPKDDRRDQINDTWANLRKMSETLHCLVVTATQVKATAYEADLMDRRHFAGDNRKFNHVTGMVGINMTATEKERGLCRLNWIVLREGDFSPRHFIHIAGCLALSNPMCLGSYPERKEM